MKNLENSETNKGNFVSYEHFFSALNESSKLNNVIKKFDELTTLETKEKSEDQSRVTCCGVVTVSKKPEIVGDLL